MAKPRNPYELVKWDSVTHLHSISHDHVYNQEHFDSLYNRGIRHISPSHYTPSHHWYPLENHFNVPSDVIGSPNSEKTRMLGGAFHFGALGSLYNSGGHQTPDDERLHWKDKYDNTLNGLQFEDGGGIVQNHMSITSLSQVKERLSYDDRVLGIEIWNGRLASYPDGQIRKGRGFYLDLWDEILKTGTQCFGFCGSDSHSGWNNNSMGRNVLLVDNVEEHEALKAYRKGRFYGALMGNIIEFTDISLENGVFSVVTDDADFIKIVTAEKTITIEGNQAEYNVTNNDLYVRAEAHKEGYGLLDIAPDEVIFTNAIFIDEIPEKPNFKKEWQKKFLLLS